MRSIARVAAIATIAAFAVPAAAEAAPAPPAARADDVIVRLEGGYHPVDRWVWYSGQERVARLNGMVHDRWGRYRAPVDFARVATLADQLCTTDAPFTLPVGKDQQYLVVQVRCGERWVSFTTASRARDEAAPTIAQRIVALDAFADGLPWRETADAKLPPPDLVRFAKPNPPTRETPPSRG